MAESDKRFRIALSFPGERRPFVERVAECLADAVGRESVLYDGFYEGEFARPDLDTYLQRLYHQESELIAVFLCAEYQEKEWCGLEWRAVRDLIKRRKSDAVMPLRFDDTEIPGLFSTDGYVWIGERSPREVADVILQRMGCEPDQRPPGPDAPRVRWTDQLRIYGEAGLFAGRRAELQMLDQTLEDGAARVVSLWAEGGAGKTRLLFQWLNCLRDEGWRGLTTVFVHSFYSRGSGEDRGASSDQFFDQALDFFGYAGEPITDPTAKGRELAGRVAAAGALLVLDGLEPLQYPPHNARRGELKDPAVRELLLTLTNAPDGLCVLTTRQELPELESRRGAAVRQRPLDRLSPEDGAELLQALGIEGTEEELRSAVEDYHGHAYSLMLLGTYLREATGDRDIRRRHDFPLLEMEEEHEHHADHIFDTYENHLGSDGPEIALLRLLGYFNRPARPELIEVLRAPEGVEYDSPGDEPKSVSDSVPEVTGPLLKMGEANWQRLLHRLEDLRLISVGEDGALDSHPLLREHFAGQLRQDFPAAYRDGHRRLYEHLKKSADRRPDTLAGLQPLYAAVSHGCEAGLHAEARRDIYRDRILRGTGSGGNYSTFQLGAFGADLGAVACFFEEPWTRPSPNLSEPDQAWLLNEAAFSLRALGRLTEAREPMRASIRNYQDQENWKAAAITAGNLSELELTLGEVAAAVREGVRSVEFADGIPEDWQMFIVTCTTYADALHQAGRRQRAGALFEEAEAMQAESQPGYPRLYSLAGFQYCDLLLAGAERAAWLDVQRSEGGGQRPEDGGQRSETAERRAELVEACREVEERVCKELNRRKDLPTASLLDIALNHLTLARAGLYREILRAANVEHRTPSVQRRTDNDERTTENGEPTEVSGSIPVGEEIGAAVEGLRQSGQMDDLPRGLLTRALFRLLRGDSDGCRADLEEARRIAERGPMRLFLADIHLHRARLFGDPEALQKAAELIEETGYGRREEEVEDAREIRMRNEE